MFKKKASLLFIACFVVYSFFDIVGDFKVEAERVLPAGVVEIEIGDWTKTREPEEIGQGEKKLNSYAEMGGFNSGISDDDVESIEGLYDASWKLRDIGFVNNNRESSGGEAVATSGGALVEALDENDAEAPKLGSEENDGSSTENLESKSKENNGSGAENLELVSKKNNGNIDLASEKIEKQGELDLTVEDTELEGEVQENNDTEKVVESEAEENNRNSTEEQKEPKVVASEVEKSSRAVNSEPVVGGKVLRTIVNNSDRKLSYDVSTLCEYLKADNPINWQNDMISWDLKTSECENCVEWRMVSGKFEITNEQISLLDSNKYQLVLGVPRDEGQGFELIVPFNDVLSVFINGKEQGMNYMHSNLLSSYFINGTNVNYSKVLLNECNNSAVHSSFCNHTCGYHVDIEVLNIGKEILKNNLHKNVRAGENIIDFLIGSSASLGSESFGFSRLNLYMIEKPDAKVDINFYTYRDSEVVYFSGEDLPDLNQEVYFEVVVENLSSSYALENINLEVKLNDTFVLIVSGNGIFYRGQKVEGQLSRIDRREAVTISSDRFRYTVSKTNCVKGFVYSTVMFRGTYITETLPYLVSFCKEASGKEGRIKTPVETDIATLRVNFEIEDFEDDGEFLLEVGCNDNLCNLLLKDGQVSVAKNLSLKEYNLKLILPQGYEVVECANYVSFSNVNISRELTVKARRKNMKYFYRNECV